MWCCRTVKKFISGNPSLGGVNGIQIIFVSPLECKIQMYRCRTTSLLNLWCWEHTIVAQKHLLKEKNEETMDNNYYLAFEQKSPCNSECHMFLTLVLDMLISFYPTVSGVWIRSQVGSDRVWWFLCCCCCCCCCECEVLIQVWVEMG